MAQMNPDQLRTLLDAEIQNSATWASDAIREDQSKNLAYYHGLPLGNEVEGRSQVVSMDVFEIVESAMPGFIEPFFSGDNVGKFLPKTQDDEAYCEQATDLVNHVILEQNKGYMLFTSWIKDALLSKVGIVRADWEDGEKKRKQFASLSDEQLAMLAQDEATEIIEHTAYPIPGMPELNQAQIIQSGGQVPMLHDVTVLQKCAGRVEIEGVRAENFVLSSRCANTDEARAIGEFVVMTRSELKEDGFKQYATVTSYDLAQQMGRATEELLGDALNLELRADDVDPSMEEIRLFKGFIKADYNGDGIAEWRRVLVGGGEDPFLENEEAEYHNYCVISPILLPHRVVGLSYADIARPIQDIKTVLTRQYLDSLYQANQQSLYVNTSAGVSMDDVLSRRIGKIIRGNRPYQEAIAPIVTSNVSREALEGIQLADGMRETRLGIPKFNPGLESDALHKTATAVRSINNLVDKRQKMTLRNMAETGIKDLFRLVLRLLVEYQDQASVVRLRGKWVQFDPRGWSPDLDCSIEVGIGTSDESETMAMLQQLGQYMTWAQSVGVVQPKNIYEYGVMLAKNARIKGADERLLTDPATLPPQPQQPPPQVMVKQMELQADQQKFQAQQQMDANKFQAEAQMQMQIDQNRQEWEAKQKQLQLQQTAELEQLRAGYEAQKEADRLAFERWKVELTESVKLQIAGMGHALDASKLNQSAQQHSDQRQDAAMESRAEGLNDE